MNQETVATVKANIDDRLANAKLDREVRRRLQQASDLLARAQEDLAKDDIGSALRHIKRAVWRLVKAEKLGLVVGQGTDLLVAAARQAAVDMLGEARRYAGSEKKIDRLIRRASEQLDKADQAWGKGKARKAVQYARNAWKTAHRAAVLGAAAPPPPPPDLETFTAPPFCAGPLQVQGVNAFVCEFPFNWVFTESDLAQFATSQFGVTIQAVGGNGGDGGSSLGGTTGAGSGGQPGLAQTTIRGDALAGKSLYIYVGNNGNFGAAGKGGNGGAVTAVATQKLGPTPSTLDGILVAAGGGGGGQGFAGSTPPCVANPGALSGDFENVACAGGDGGVAIAIDEQNRLGFARLGATPPAANTSNDPFSDSMFNLGAGQPARFDAGKWLAGAGGSGGSAGSAAFSFAGAPAAGSPANGTWVRETPTLTLGKATVLGGNGAGTGGAAGGGVAGGGGAGNAGGAGGASYAVGSNYGLASGQSFPVPCEMEGFCARNWLSPAPTDQPTVVITFWENLGATPVIPKDGETIATGQPSLVFEGASASSGIQYLLENDVNQTVNYGGLINGSATGNLLWTVPPGLLDAGQTYNWFITDQSGKQLQAPRSFTVASGTGSGGSSQGWTLYVRSMDTLDMLPQDLEPLSNQPVPAVSTSCSCTCQGTCIPIPGVLDCSVPTKDGFQQCTGINTDSDQCSCTYNATGGNVTDSKFWVWTQAPDCHSSTTTCYGNARVTRGTLDVDWSSPTEPLALQVPSRLTNITSEPPPSPNGEAPPTVPSLALPALGEDFQGSCAQDLIEVTFTARTNGGIRFDIYADPQTGAPSDTPASAIDYWEIPSCDWQDILQVADGKNANSTMPIATEEQNLYKHCQASVNEQVGKQTFCLAPETPYRVRFDAVVPDLPGPMELGFELPGMDSSAPIPANWVSTCALDTTTNNCSSSAADLGTAAVDLEPAGEPRSEETSGPSQNAKVKTPASSVPLETPSDPTDGTAGAANCSATGTSIQCLWNQNGTWKLPGLYTQPGGWVVIQALGGAGGAGYPAANNPGGAPGRAQAVVPAESLAGKTLDVYVGESGIPGSARGGTPGGGGAASLVTTTMVPSSFVSNDCVGTPESLGALVIAAGGGGGGQTIETGGTTAAGFGGTAVGGSGVQNVIGSGAPGGQGEKSYGGQAPSYGSNPFDGTQTISGGYSVFPVPFSGSGPIALGGAGFVSETDISQTASWVSNTSFLALEKPGNTEVCGGGVAKQGGGGGGGHAGGGGGFGGQEQEFSVIYPAAGGGGSSWAIGAGAGVTLPASLSGWQTLSNNDPGQVVITAQCPDCDLLTECAMEQSSQRPVMRCTFKRSVQALSLSTLSLAVEELIGQQIGDDVPVYLEAWGGGGGQGGFVQAGFDTGCGAGGGGPGHQGYARSSYSYGALKTAASTLWLYVGAKGVDGATSDGTETRYGIPGAGGAATLTLKAPISNQLADVLLIAGAGGGGGQGSCSSLDSEQPGELGQSAGGAVATTGSAAATPFPTGREDPSGGNGMGGSDRQKTPGNDGIGGLGGGAGNDEKTGWVGISSAWTAGQGAQSQGGSTEGGAGGGGYGGGGAGDIGSQGSFRGGGAGGSYAAQAALNDSGAPVLGPSGDPNGANGAVVITFDVCETYPTLSVCQP